MCYHVFLPFHIFYIYTILCMCVHWYLDWAIWPNYELADFHPQSGIATVLDTAASDHHLFYPPTPSVFAAFWIILFYHPSYRPPSVLVVVLSPLCHTLSPPHFPEQNAFCLYVSHTCHPPASIACIFALRCIPVSSDISCVCSPPSFRSRPDI